MTAPRRFVPTRRARAAVTLVGAVVLASLLPPAPAAAVGCIVLPSGQCADEPPRLLGGWVADERTDRGPRIVVVPAPTPERVTIELRLDLPAFDIQADDRVIARILLDEDGDGAGAERAARRAALGAHTRLEQGPGAIVLRTDAPEHALPELLTLEAERLSRFAPDIDGVRRAEAAVSLDGRRLGEAPDSLLVALAVGTVGPETAPAAPATLVERLGSTWYGPASTVVIAGDVDVDHVAGLVRAAWDRLPPPLDAAPAAAPRPTDVHVPHISAESPRAARTRVALAWPLPAALHGTRRGAFAELVRELLIAPGSPLHRAVGADALRVWSPDTPGSLVLAIELAPGADPDRVLAAARRAAAGLAETADAPFAGAVEQARAHLVARATVELQDAHGWAHAAGRVMASGAPPEGVDRRVDVLRQVEVPDVRQAAAELLAPDRLRTVQLSPTRTSP